MASLIQFLVALVSRLFRRRRVLKVSLVLHKDDQVGWKAMAGNERIVFTAEGFTRAEDAERAARDACASKLVFDEASPVQVRVLQALRRKP